METQSRPPSLSQPQPSAAMFDRATVQGVERSELNNNARDMFKIVFNYYSNNSSSVSAGTSQAAGNGGEYVDAINHLLETLPVIIKELDKNRSRSTVGTATSPDSSSPRSQAVDTENTPRSPISESLVDADISNMVPLNPLSLPVASVADRYARSILRCLRGYPLYNPQPFSEYSKEYLQNGVNVGDVGFVTEDGTFDFLFNICPSNGTTNPPDLPDGFYLNIPKHSEIRPMIPVPRKTRIFHSPVKRTDSGKYRCEGPDGAILELPEGGIECDAIHKIPFKTLAARHGIKWYDHTMTVRGRDIPNGSLYLITSFTKCSQWGIAVFDQPCDSRQGLKLNRELQIPFRNSTTKYHWKGSGTSITKVSINPNQKDAFSQCVFLRGYKITIRQDIFDNLYPTRLFPLRHLKYKVVIKSLSLGDSQRLRGGGGTDLMSRIWTRKTPTMIQSNEVFLQANFTSSLVHPSDLINAALLSRNPDAKIALTHDDVWCDILRLNIPKLDHATLINIAQSYTNVMDEYGCVFLEKISDSSNKNSVSPPTSHGAIMSSVQKNNNGVHAILYEVCGDTVTFQLGDGQYTEQEKCMIRDHLSNIIVFKLLDTNHVMNITKSHSLTRPILNLPNPQAAYNDYKIKKRYRPCVKGTRVALLQGIADWVSGADETRAYVLSGPGGIGKSTIAYTIATQADALGLLGASFFFSRDDTNRNNGKMFFTAIAYQLCLYSELFATAIEAALLTRPLSDAKMEDSQEQLKTLILEPLGNILRSRIRPILVVVDGLDECAKEDGHSILTGLTQLVRDLPSFKLILTTRPQSHLDRFFHTPDNSKILHLQCIKDKVINNTRPYFQPPSHIPADRPIGESFGQAIIKQVIRTDLSSIRFSENFNITETATASVATHPQFAKIGIESNSYGGTYGLETLKEFISFSAPFPKILTVVAILEREKLA